MKKSSESSEIFYETVILEMLKNASNFLSFTKDEKRGKGWGNKMAKLMKNWMNIKQSLEIVAIGQAWFSEELMTKTKKSCGMLKSLRPEEPSLQWSERGCGWNSRYQKIGGFSPDLADPHLSPSFSPPDDGPQFKTNPRSFLHSFDMLQWNVAGKM